MSELFADVGQNHFEPLRTALGTFVGETAFIGNCNLMLEGVSDQVYLARMSDVLTKSGFASTESLDLNRITLVPSGSASHIPYMVFLARGRDADKPAVIVLLDGDEAGLQTRKKLRRGGFQNRQLLRQEYILQLGKDTKDKVESERPDGPLEIEDLLAVDIAIDAVKRYLHEIGFKKSFTAPTAKQVISKLSETVGVYDAVCGEFVRAGVDVAIDKIGFARHATDSCSENNENPGKDTRQRFAALFALLTKMQRRAELDRQQESIAARVKRETGRFLRIECVALQMPMRWSFSNRSRL